MLYNKPFVSLSPMILIIIPSDDDDDDDVKDDDDDVKDDDDDGYDEKEEGEEEDDDDAIGKSKAKVVCGVGGQVWYGGQDLQVNSRVAGWTSLVKSAPSRIITMMMIIFLNPTMFIMS